LGHALDVSAEVLPPHDLLDRFQRIAFGADRLKPALNIEKARLPHDSLARSAHGPLRSASQIRTDLARRIFSRCPYDIVEMTDCILEAINSSRQASISGLTGRQCPSISRRLGHGSTQHWPLDGTIRLSDDGSECYFLDNRSGAVIIITSLASN